MTTGQYVGIGALIGKRNGNNTVIMPYVGFPAHKAGLQIGDELTAVNGINVEKKSTTEISKLLKGQANTELTLTIRRYGVEDEFDVDQDDTSVIDRDNPMNCPATELESKNSRRQDLLDH